MLLEEIVGNVEYILDTKEKRHVVGGALISLSLLCAGLAVTVMTIKEKR